VRGPGEVTKLRYGGLLAAGVLAAGAYRSGSLPHDDPGFGIGVIACLVGMAGLVAAWWRTGIAVRAGSLGLRWLLVTGSLWALPLLAAPPLASRDVYAYACQGSLYADGVDPYSAGALDGGCPWVESVSKVWRNTPTPYGPLAVAVSGIAVRLACAATEGEYARLVLAVGLLRAVAVLGVVLMAWSAVRLARACGVDPLVATWLGVLSPLVAVHLLSAAHHDGLIAGLMLAGLAFAVDPGTSGPGFAAHRRTRWMPVVAAGVVLGLATAVKVTAVVALPFAVLLVARQGRSVRAAAGLVAAAAGAFAAASALTGLGLGWAQALPTSGRVVQWTSVPSGVGMTASYLLTGSGNGTAVVVARLAGLAVLVAVLAWLWLRAAGLRARAARASGPWLQVARTPPDTRAVVLYCGAALAACALLAPVFFPWYAAAPLAVLAVSVADQRVRWRLAVAVVALGFLILPNGHGLASLTKLPGAIADTVLVAALVWRRRRAIRGWLIAGARAVDGDRSRTGRVVDATR
jgi:alpha-1,6-mannosyltransferase